jgi:hypothetical protein
MLSELIQFFAFFAIFIQYLRKLNLRKLNLRKLTIPYKEKENVVVNSKARMFKSISEDNKKKVAVKENGMRKIDFSLLSEIIFTNDVAFNNIDTVTAKMLNCVCKNAGLNKTIKMKLDVYKTRCYYDKFKNIINRNSINQNHNIEDFITEFKEIAKENAVVNDGFRELVVIDYKLSLYCYSNLECYTETYDIDKEYLLEQCVQYLKVIQCLGFYDYYKDYDSNYANNYVREPVHFIKAPENIYEYEYVPNDNFNPDDEKYDKYDKYLPSVSHEFVFAPFPSIPIN